MDKTKIRPILFGVLIGILSIVVLSLLSARASLKKTNQNLSDILQARLSAGKQADESLKVLQDENAALQASLKENADRLASIQEEKSYLEEMLINKTKQIELLQKNGGSSEAAPLPSFDRDEEMKRLVDQNRLLQEKLDRLYKTTSARINEINIAKIALEETVSTAKKKIEDEWNTVDLGAVSAAPASSGPARAARSQGHVLAINPEHGFVVVDLGRADRLPNGATLEVTKNGQPVATLSVLEIRDVMAACNIKDITDGQKIEINDLVSLKTV